MITETPEERRRRMLEAMSQSIRPRVLAGSDAAYRFGDDPTLKVTPPPSPALSDTPPINVSIPPPTSTPAPPPPEFVLPSQPAPTPVAPQMKAPGIGYSLNGLTGVDRLMEIRKAHEEADPESKVKVMGDYAGVEPPTAKNKRNRWKSLGTGLLTGLAMSDPDQPLQGLGMALGGGLTGAVSPRSGARLKRRFEMNQLDNDIARGLQLEQAGQRGRSPLGGLSTRIVGEGEYDGIEAGTEIRVRIDPRTNEVVDVIGPDRRPVVSKTVKESTGAPHYEKDAEGYLITVQGGVADRVKDRSGQPIKVKATNEAGEAIEIETPNGSRRIEGLTPGQILNYYGQVGKAEGKSVADQTKRTAKLNESSALYKKAENNEVNAKAIDGHIAKLEAGKASFFKDGNIPNPDDIKPFDTQIEDLRKQRQQLLNEANDWRVKGDAARAEGESIPEATTTPSAKYSGRTMSQANLERYAKDKGISIEEARKKVEGMGVRIQ